MDTVEEKICATCGKCKPLPEYYFINAKGKHMNNCKGCYSINRKGITRRYIEKNKVAINKRVSEYCKNNPQKRREYYYKNRDKLIALNKASYEKNREINIQKRKDWYQQNKESHAAARERYAIGNKDKLRTARRKWENERLSEDMNYKLHKNLSGRIRFELKGIAKRSGRTEELIGCNIQQLKEFIENQFQEGMAWDNWETNGWHVDHRIPLSWFNLQNENCRKLAFNYKNLQPLWGVDNIKKKNFYSHKMVL